MENQLTQEQIKELAEQEKQVRADRCGKKIAETLKEENCKLDVGMLITTQGSVPQLKIIAL